MRTRTSIVALASLVIVATLSAGSAGAAWRNVNITHVDTGQVCEDGLSLSIASPETDYEITITDTQSALEVATATTELAFGPVPEVFGAVPGFNYNYFGTLRIFYTSVPTPQAGDELQITLQNPILGESVDTVIVEDCQLAPAFVGFTNRKNLPLINNGTKLASYNGTIAIKFNLRANRGLSIFSEGPKYAHVNCSINEPNPSDTDTSLDATGTLKFLKAKGLYNYVWQVPPGLTGCQEVWFRTAYDGLTHRLLFNFGA